MKAYFDFFIDEIEMKFNNARFVVKLYENYTIEHIRIVFLKIKEQLDEIEESLKASSKPAEDAEYVIDANQDEEVSDEQKRKAARANSAKAPVVHSVEIDKHSG